MLPLRRGTVPKTKLVRVLCSLWHAAIFFLLPGNSVRRCRLHEGRCEPHHLTTRPALSSRPHKHQLPCRHGEPHPPKLFVMFLLWLCTCKRWIKAGAERETETVQTRHNSANIVPTAWHLPRDTGKSNRKTICISAGVLFLSKKMLKPCEMVKVNRV